MKYVNQPVVKIDAAALTRGKPVYTDDLAPKDCLVVKLLRSPHAHAYIEEIHVAKAEQMPGVACILTYRDVPQKRFTIAGQSYPEPSPYDRLILDRKMRFVGDVAAIVAADTEEHALDAIKRIKIKYRVLEPILDFEKALDSQVIVHDEENYHLNMEVGNDRMRNQSAAEQFVHNDVDEVLAQCDCVVDQTYYTQACNQSMMETFRAYTYMDHNNRLNIVSSTQIPFHVRRIAGFALELPLHRIRVQKPRVGGGFGAKQTVVCELYPAIVTLKTGRPAKIVFDRRESFITGGNRHPMRIRVRIGSDAQGNIQAIDVDALSNTGAYGEHGGTTVGLVGHKSIPLYNRVKASRFTATVVYTNQMPSGAYRGYGATQGCFAVESAVNALAANLQMDPIVLRQKNLVMPNEVMPAYYGERLLSSKLAECIEKGKAMIGWDEKYPAQDMGNGKIRGVGMAISMQGSGIAGLDTASACIRLNDHGFYTLYLGSADMGTGSDTILAQMAADSLHCSLDQVIVSSGDTDTSPFDKGSYASSTTYVTGQAVIKAAGDLVNKIKAAGARLLEVEPEQVEFNGQSVYAANSSKEISLDELAQKLALGSGEILQGFATHGSPVSPPPFVAGFAEVEVDKLTGMVRVIQMVGVIDCGTIINKNLTRVQAEGGFAQGIGMALFEDVQFTDQGKLMSNSFMQYKIPARTDVGKIRIAFEESYEPTGPFGAKSIGEVVINTPAPAIAAAIYNAAGVQIRDLPITAEKIYQELQKQQEKQ
jgi:putative selenate reductase molybdopterin-binding subunit